LQIHSTPINIEVNDSIETKCCNKCKEVKPINEFGVSSRYKSGYIGTCKQCRQVICLTYYYKNHDKCLINHHDYYIKNNRKEYHLDYRTKHDDVIKARYQDRKQAYNHNRKIKYQNNLETKSRRLICNRKYAQSKIENLHPNHDFNIEQKLYKQAEKLFNTTGIKYVVDHIIPLAKGGPHHHDNLQLLPESINSNKLASITWTHPSYKCWLDLEEKVWDMVKPENLIKIIQEYQSHRGWN